MRSLLLTIACHAQKIPHHKVFTAASLHRITRRGFALPPVEGPMPTDVEPAAPTTAAALLFRLLFVGAGPAKAVPPSSLLIVSRRAAAEDVPAAATTEEEEEDVPAANNGIFTSFEAATAIDTAVTGPELFAIPAALLFATSLIT